MRRLALIATFFLTLIAAAPAFAQCAAVPPLADVERRTQYAISAQTGPFAVGFPVYGDGTDFGNWLQVYINGTLISSINYTVTSPTTTLATGCRPITDLQVTFGTAQTGTLQIVGARRPRVTSQFPENRGVAARDLNQRLTDITAVDRERWDQINRAVQGVPGEVLTQLPPAASRANKFLMFDLNGNPTTPAAGLGTGNVTGPPGGVVNGHIAVFSGTTGTVLSDGGTPGIAPGVDSNILNAQTAVYSATVDDCGKTITLGGAAFYSLTFGPAAGFPSTCSIVVANIDSTRGKRITINGGSFPNAGILWPLQTFALKNENNAWTLFYAPGRWKIPSAVTFFIDPAGSNNNDGLATGATGAFQTISGALSVVSQILDANLQKVTFSPLCGGTTYTENVSLVPILGAAVGGSLVSNNVNLTGDTVTPTNCVINGVGASPTLSIIGPMNDWIVAGFKITNGGTGQGIVVDAGSWLRTGALNFGATGGAFHVQAENGATWEPMANYTISGAPAAYHVATAYGGKALAGGLTVVTVTGTPNFAGAFTLSNTNSVQQWIGVTFSGAATGPRTSIDSGGGIDTGGVGGTMFPGNSNPAPITPGWIR